MAGTGDAGGREIETSGFRMGIHEALVVVLIAVIGVLAWMVFGPGTATEARRSSTPAVHMMVHTHGSNPR